ncbi:MAG: NADH-quinone oxidoreductase subunit NuoB, partial [Peptococcaceae bacterium]|nr:NADH-quinone oxidoreductase subunit NuoB [Peptococcaceae bacterium]
MLKMLKKMLEHRVLTNDYPRQPAEAPRAATPLLDPQRCDYCGACATRCPADAIVLDQEAKIAGIDYARCIFCLLCEEVCPRQAAQTSGDFELAARTRQELRPALPGSSSQIPDDRGLRDPSLEVLQAKLKTRIHKLYGRSLHIREVDAGSCNACDYEVNALNNPFNDIERLGISFVASPRHADMLLVTGAPSRNMQTALLKTYQATPDPKLVVAMGACAISGGIFRDSYATGNGIDTLIPVDVYIPGCPP